MTIILLTQRKGEQITRKEFDDANQLDAMNEGSLIKFEDKSVFVAIFTKDSKIDKMFIRCERENEF